MANLPAPLVAAVEVRWSLFGQQCENTFHVRGADAWSPTTLADLNAIVNAWIGATYSNMVTSSLLFTEIQSTGLDTVDGPQVTTSSAIPGDLATPPLPNETSFCVSLRSGLTGRSRRGRWYMPPPLVAERADANTVTATYANTARDAMFTLMTTLQGEGIPMGVLSRISNKAVRPVPLFTPYQSATYVNLILDSMRTRRPGNGA